MRGLVGTLLLALAGAIAADPLFESDEPLAITLDGPFRQLNKERDKSRTYAPAFLIYRDNGEPVKLPVELQARGNRRLSAETCAFPPLRVIVDKKLAGRTLFREQKKLKLVTQCSLRGNRYKQYLLTEYLIYKALNALTDNSYRVRLAEMTYRWADGNKMFRDRTRRSHAFFLESNRRLAKRINRQRWQARQADPARLDGRHTNLISLFQFMIGNTDWSAVRGGDDECCHNGKLFGEPEGQGNLFLPYDFDMTGLVNPKYAVTPPALRLNNIRERRYRGYCRNNRHLEGNIALFNEKRDELIGLFRDSPLLDKTVKKRRVAYIEKFYRIINNPERIKRHIHKWCHKSKSQ